MTTAATPFSVKMGCPIKNDCPWRGYISQTPEHCKGAHPGNYLKNVVVKMEAEKDEGTRVFLHMKNEIVFVIKIIFNKGNLKVKFNCLHFELWVDNTNYIISLQKVGKRKTFDRVSGNISRDKEVCLKVKHSSFVIRIDLSVMAPLLLYYETTRERISCSICKHLMAMPIYQCTKGAHIMCANCAGFKKFCKICGVFTWMETLPLLENLALMLQTSCMHAKDGCTVQGCVIDVRIHEAECVHRQLQCSVCKWVGNINDFPQHLKNKHKEINLSFLNQLLMSLPDADSEALIFKHGIIVLISFKHVNSKERALTVKLIGPAGLEAFFSIVVKLGDNSATLNSINERKFKCLSYIFKIEENVKSIMVELLKHA